MENKMAIKDMLGRLRTLYPVDKKEHKFPEIAAVSTGEKRYPRKGEYFLSGAEVTAYEAYQDLTQSYHIARIMKVKITTTYEEISC